MMEKAETNITAWKKIKFKRAVNIKNGKDYKSVESVEGYPVFGSGGVFAYSSEFLYSGKAILLGRKGTIDKPLYVNGAFWTVDTMFYAVPLKGYHAKFIFYCSQTIPFNLYQNDTAIPSMTQSVLNNHEFLVPDYKLQNEIANFLDRETDRIDQLIEKKQSLISLLQGKIKALSFALATQGMSKSINFKNTSLTPLTQVPENWEVIRIANIFSESSKMGGDNLPVLSVSINWGISDRELGDEDRHRIVNHIEDKNAYKHVKVGYLVYNMMRAWQGAFGVAKVEGLVSPAYVVAKPKRNLHAPYFEYLLRTPLWIEEFRRASKGIADFRQRLYWEHFRQIYVVLPPIEEQIIIASEIEKKAQSINKLVEKVKHSIEKLQEFRISLITEAVTGQLDIKSGKKRGSTDKRLDNIEEVMRI